MTKNEIVELLNEDLKNELKHLRFYLYHASSVSSLHREEYKELFLKEAQAEMMHVLQFSDVIRGLDAIPTSQANDFETFSDPREILTYAIKMEMQVVENYVRRIEDADLLRNGPEKDSVNAKWLEIFLENQIEDSREDVDNFKQILRGM